MKVRLPARACVFFFSLSLFIFNLTVNQKLSLQVAAQRTRSAAGVQSVTNQYIEEEDGDRMARSGTNISTVAAVGAANDE